MDGIPSSLTSVTPILPETMLISEKGGITGPQVEIMPLPDNSFNSGDAAAELLNTPFTLSLDVRGRDGNESGSRSVGRAGLPAGRIPMNEDPSLGTMLSDAYTLSLGGDDVPAASEMARELTRMKSYEMLGKAVRQTYRMNPQTLSAEQNAAGTPEKTNILISDRVRNFLAQSSAGPGELFAQTAAPDVTVSEEAQQEPLFSQPDNSAVNQGAPQVRQHQPQALISGALAFQLTPSDYEAILALEPDLQETLLNMLGNGGAIPTAPAQPDQGYLPISGSNPAGQSAGIIPAPLSPALTAALFDSDGSILRNVMPEIPAQNMTVSPGILSAQSFRAPDGTRLYIGMEDAASRLSAIALAAALGAQPGSVMPTGAGIANLQKITELPYSLYVFGSMTPEKRPGEYDDDESSAAKKIYRETSPPSEFLRLADAVKMAAVLHHIYHGGSGLFPAETPWYAPYIQYAVRYGIIKNGEFDDLNEFATRAETAYIFSNCVPKTEFQVINAPPLLSDVDEYDGYGDAVLLLHKAGVLVTNDRHGRFYPERMITRSEAATIIGRIATPADRKKT